MLCGEHLQEFGTVYFIDSEPTKLLNHPKQKPRRGGGLRQIKTYRQVPLQVNFKRKADISGLVSLKLFGPRSQLKSPATILILKYPYFPLFSRTTTRRSPRGNITATVCPPRPLAPRLCRATLNSSARRLHSTSWARSSPSSCRSSWMRLSRRVRTAASAWWRDSSLPNRPSRFVQSKQRRLS